MRKIEFRGKRIDNDEWAYGYYVKDWDNKSYIITELGGLETHCSDCGMQEMNSYEVDPSTVGQFTGLFDKNDIKIYEGDIVELEDRYVVPRWNEYLYQFDCEFLKYKENIDNEFTFNGIRFNELRRYKVIGNMYDKEEL